MERTIKADHTSDLGHVYH